MIVTASASVHAMTSSGLTLCMNCMNCMLTVTQVPGPEPHQGAGQGSSGGSDTSEERRGGGRGRGRVTRHISIDDTPITHTYHQNSLESTSESSHSPSEVEFVLLIQ